MVVVVRQCKAGIEFLLMLYSFQLSLSPLLQPLLNLVRHLLVVVLLLLLVVDTKNGVLKFGASSSRGKSRGMFRVVFWLCFLC